MAKRMSKVLWNAWRRDLAIGGDHGLSFPLPIMMGRVRVSAVSPDAFVGTRAHLALIDDPNAPTSTRDEWGPSPLGEIGAIVRDHDKLSERIR